jgi:hypothetical protein
MTKLRRQKLADRFNQLDADRDGFIDHEDLAARAQNLCDHLVPADQPRARELVVDGYDQLWKLLSAADTDHDDRVSKAEFTEAVETGVLADPSAFHRCVARIASGLFMALDADRDDRLSFDELATIGSVYAVPLRDVESFFLEADTSNDTMDLDTFLQAVESYYYSDQRDLVLGKAMFVKMA